ncbi:hypothetical protein [Bartonella massiliensis]|uniref:hypothetical protein n=1 Tax=Bartonella massiliensis TaxID=929795 RepID=UPI001159DC40|nr:hypothetical protein [Bartonella massiliensis]
MIFECFSIISLTATTIHAGVSIWLGYRKHKEQVLGPKLQINYTKTLANVPYDSNENPTFKVDLTCYNPTKQAIKINNIWLDPQSPFQFVEALYPSPNHKIIREQSINISIKPKYINLIDPKLKPEPESTFDLFNVESKKELTILLTIQAMQPDIVNPINITLEHTSSNYPNKTLKAFYCIGFFRFSETQRVNFLAKISKTERALYRSLTRNEEKIK